MCIQGVRSSPRPGRRLVGRLDAAARELAVHLLAASCLRSSGRRRRGRGRRHGGRARLCLLAPALLALACAMTGRRGEPARASPLRSSSSVLHPCDASAAAYAHPHQPRQHPPSPSPPLQHLPCREGPQPSPLSSPPPRRRSRLALQPLGSRPPSASCAACRRAAYSAGSADPLSLPLQLPSRRLLAWSAQLGRRCWRWS